MLYTNRNITKDVTIKSLTNDCWDIQINGISACDRCKLLNGPECGGKRIRKKLKKLNKGS